MKRLDVLRKQDMQMAEVDFPKCIKDHAVIKMTACGICGSDLTAYGGINPTVKYPIHGIGHEGVGEIVEIEDDESHLKVGDRVVLEPYVPCFECPMCKVERYNNCENLKVCGVHKDGMMAEYFLHPVKLLYKVPDSVNDIEATLTEPFTIGLHALTRADVKADEYCVVFGAGTIGVLAALGAKLYGATPIVVDIINKRLEKAKELGISHVINSMETNVVEELKKITGGKLPESMIECTGALSVLMNAHEFVAHGGRISLVGWPHEPVQFNQVRIMQKEISIHASRNSNKKFPESLGYIRDKRIPLDGIISKIVTFNEVEDSIRVMIEKPEDFLKVVSVI